MEKTFEKEIQIDSKCVLCDEHKTNLGNLVRAVKGVYSSKDIAEFNFTDDHKLLLVKTMYEQFCLDQRTAQIQGYKKDNIKSIKR